MARKTLSTPLAVCFVIGTPTDIPWSWRQEERHYSASALQPLLISQTGA